VAELLPGPRSGREPAGDGPNSPWFDWRRARGTDGSADGSDDAQDPESAESESGSADEVSVDVGSAEDASADETALRAFPWFG
jgi:hypothetical protein